MNLLLTRRGLLAGALSSAGTAALAGAPLTTPRPRPRPGGAGTPLEALISRAGLGGQTAAVLADARTGLVIEAVAPELTLPPASTAKVPTAAYALEVLGPAYRFPTRLLATGPIAGGRLEGDLILQGGGDPVLDTDGLAELAAALKALGVIEVRGGFRVDGGALPVLPQIDGQQPDHVGYNPSVAGLNLNFNRVHFEWKRSGSGYVTTMQARARRARPGVAMAAMEIVDRAAPVYTYDGGGPVERWTVARGALGLEGARWLPVRRPLDYVADTFRSLARSHGIELPPVSAGPVAGVVIAERLSPPLAEILADMLDYSTNLTAEVVGLTASATLGPVPASLAASAARMNGWAAARHGLATPALIDHSGLGYDNRISAADMARVMAGAADMRVLLDTVRMDEGEPPVQAKTGTLNFVSALSGHIGVGGADGLVFAIVSADIPRRDAIAIDQRERPAGARGWANRARRLQKDMIREWAGRYRA